MTFTLKPVFTKLKITKIQKLQLQFNDSQILMIRTSLQDIYVYLDGNLIYEKTYGNSLTQTYASSWHFITLPAQAEGMEFMLELSSPYQSMTGRVNHVFYGTEVMHYRYLMRNYGPRLIIGIIVLFIGLVVMISDLFMRNAREKGFVYLGLFAVILSFWMIAESRMLQFFTGSELLMGTLAYIALPAFTIPMIIYLTEYVLVNYKKLISWMKYLFVTHLVVIIVLHLTGISDYFETVIYSQLWIAMGIIVSIIALILDYKKNKTENSKSVLKGFLALAIFVFIEFMSFLFGRFEKISLYFSIGIIFIMAYMFMSYFKYIIERLKISYQTELYEQLAYTDHVIQGKNRLAFERDLDKVLNDESQNKDLRLILFDLNNLKKINDTYGHITGDEAIKKAFDIMSEVFRDYGECYRVGGDEFACIYLNNREDVFYEKINKLENFMNEYNENSKYRLGLSLGSAVLDVNSMTHSELYEKADQMMYEYRKLKNKEVQ